MTYDPYSYYTCPSVADSSSIHSSPTHSLTLANKLAYEVFIHNLKDHSHSRPASLYPSLSPVGRPRSLSLCSTASVCSDDSDVDDIQDEDEEEDTRSDILHSPISPADTASTCGTFSSCGSSRPSSYFYESMSPSSPATPSSALARIQRPRGPRPRPLPSLPIRNSEAKDAKALYGASVPKIHVTVPSTPPLSLRVKLCSPPPSYAEATQSALSPTASYPWDGVHPDPAALPAEANAETIDWERVEAYMMSYNDG